MAGGEGGGSGGGGAVVMVVGVVRDVMRRRRRRGAEGDVGVRGGVDRVRSHLQRLVLTLALAFVAAVLKPNFHLRARETEQKIMVWQRFLIKITCAHETEQKVRVWFLNKK